MKILKYSLLTIAVVVGSEVLYKCLKYMFALLHQKSSDIVNEDSSDQNGKKIINKVVFFPDHGILSRSNQEDSNLERKDSNNDHQHGYRYPHHSKLVIRSLNEAIAPHSSCLKRSTSLIYLVDALDSAKCSLKVCVYVITLQDMVNALLRAKVSGFPML